MSEPMSQVILRVPMEVRLWLAEESKTSGIPQAEIIRRALENYRAASQSSPAGSLIGVRDHPASSGDPSPPPTRSHPTVSSTSEEDSAAPVERFGSARSTATRKTAESSTPPTTSTCQHPKKRIIGGGMAVCDECGMTRGPDGVWR